MPVTAIELIQHVNRGFTGAVTVTGADLLIDVIRDSHGDPLYGEVDGSGEPMDQPSFYRKYQHRLFDVDIDITVPDSTGSEEPEVTVDPDDLDTWSSADLADYIVEVIGEPRRRWTRETMIDKIKAFNGS